MPELWAGTDAGKAEHHCVVIDSDGQRKLSRRVANDETTLLNLIGDVLALSEDEPVTWAIDLNAGGAVLMIALLASNGQQVLYIPGRTVHHALWTDQRQYAPPTALLPAPAAGLLHVRAGRCPLLPYLEGVLRPQENRRQEPQASSHRPRAASIERSLGSHTRRPSLRDHCSAQLCRPRMIAHSASPDEIDNFIGNQ